ncbi:MAG TPA: hypothetical protein VMH91_00780 [Candidatus Paceibacterota bacterium]|nr:hypothetical protein [Candidatus Paceibacterota bacterium]
METQRGFIGLGVLIAIILGLIAVGGGAYYVMDQNAAFQTQQNLPELPATAVNNKPSQSAQANPTSDASDTKTYNNTQYGFTMQYPSTAQVNPDCAEGFSVCRGNPLVVFYEKSPQPINGFAYGYVVPIVSTSTNSWCNTPTGGEGNSTKYGTATIHGVQFTTSSGGDAAAGTQEAFTAYYTSHNGLCYAILDDEFSNYQGGVEQPSQSQNDLESIVQSFHFTQPAVTSSDTKIYSNAQYGFSFQYPSAAYFGTTDYGSIKTFSSSPIAYVQLTDNYQTEGYMTVSVSADSSDVAKCTSPGAFVWVDNDPNIPAQYREVLSGNAKNTIINSLTFLQYDVTSHDSFEGAERQYSAVHNGVCVDIRLSSFPSACVNSGCDNRQWSVQTETALLGKLDDIAQTFKFVQ